MLGSNSLLESLKTYFQKFGEVSDSVIMLDPITKRPRYAPMKMTFPSNRSCCVRVLACRGFGFVTYADPNSVDEMMKHGPHTLDNKTVRCFKVTCQMHHFLHVQIDPKPATMKTATPPSVNVRGTFSP